MIEDSISSNDFSFAGNNNPVGFGKNQGQLLFLYFVQPPTKYISNVQERNYLASFLDVTLENFYFKKIKRIDHD